MSGQGGRENECRSLLWSRQLTVHASDTFICFSAQEEKCPPTATAASRGTQAAGEIQSTFYNRQTAELRNKSSLIQLLLEWGEGASIVLQ